MNQIPRVSAWRRYLRFWRPNIEADIDDELRFHFAERVEDLVAQGSTPEAAHAQAVAEFGDLSSVRSNLRAIDARIIERRARVEWLAVARENMCLALRRLVRQPGFTVPAVVTLGLGLAATATVYTLLDAVVLSPLPFPRADRLVFLASPIPKLNDRWGLARHQLFYYKDRSRTLEDLALYRAHPATVMGDGGTHHAERVSGASVSAGIYSVLGIGPRLGRLLTPEDNLLNPPRVIVLGEEYWLRRFGGDPSILGRKIDVEGFPMEVVGVVPRSAQLPEQPVDVWLPDHIDPAMAAQNNHVRQAVGVLREGATVAGAKAELAQLASRMDELFPSAYPNHWVRESGFTTSVTSLRDEVVGEPMSRALWILFAAVGLVLLIAAANVANLFLVRADARRREAAVRAALGAGRAHLALHHVSEGLVIALLGGALGAVLALGGLRAVSASAPAGLPRLSEVHFGWESVALLLVAALAAGAAFGLIPLANAGVDAVVLREGARGLTPSRRRVAARSVLVIGQVAMALVLLTGAGLMVRSFERLRRVRLGFDATGVTTMAVALPSSRYRDHDGASAFYLQLSERIRAVPGVEDVGFVSALPLVERLGCTGLITVSSANAPYRGRCTPLLWVSPGYFSTMRIGVRGRSPTWAETQAGAGGVVVTHALAERLWPGEDAIGQPIRCCRPEPVWDRVVGVTDDVRANGPDEPAAEIAYFPMKPIPGTSEGAAIYMDAAVRAPTIDSDALGAIVRDLAAELDPQVPVASVRSMEEVVARSMAKRSFTMLLLGVAAAMALVLSAVGLYGVISYIVSRRRGEIGIRIALGAARSRVAAMVVRQSLTLVALGVVIGLATALVGTRLLRSLLFEVSPTDPVVLAGVSALLLLLAAAASFAPARRAAGVDPVEALRSE